MRCGIAMLVNALFISVDLLLMAHAHAWRGLGALMGVPIYIGVFSLQIVASLFGFDAALDRELRCWRKPNWSLSVVSATGLITGMASLAAILQLR